MLKFTMKIGTVAIVAIYRYGNVHFLDPFDYNVTVSLDGSFQKKPFAVQAYLWYVLSMDSIQQIKIWAFMLKQTHTQKLHAHKSVRVWVWLLWQKSDVNAI